MTAGGGRERRFRDSQRDLKRLNLRAFWCLIKAVWIRDEKDESKRFAYCVLGEISSEWSKFM